jgi:hypothetical protein
MEISAAASGQPGFDEVIFRANAAVSGSGPLFVRLAAAAP